MSVTLLSELNEKITASVIRGLYIYVGTGSGNLYRVLISTGVATLIQNVSEEITSISVSLPTVVITTSSGNVYTFTESAGGGLSQAFVTASATLSGASTSIAVAVPSGAKITGCQLIVDTLITSAAATSWAAAYSGGSTDGIASGMAFAVGTVVNSFTTAILGSAANITITPDTGTFTAGKIRAIVYYEAFSNLT